MKTSTGLAALALCWVLGGCGTTSPTFVETDPSYGWSCSETEVTCGILLERQDRWCREVTGSGCQVLVSDQHPDWAAWVDIRDRPARIVYWNHLVLGDRQFLITDFRCAHEACHLEQPAVWSESLRETMADRCATAHTGERR